MFDVYEHAFVCVCVCVVLCNVYWCELMLDSKCYWMRNNIWKKSQQ